MGRAGHGLELLGHWGLSFPENLRKKDLGKKGLRKKNFFSYKRNPVVLRFTVPTLHNCGLDFGDIQMDFYTDQL